MADSHYLHDSTLTDETDSADLSEREALLTINARRTLVLLKSVAEKTCDVLLYEPPSFWVNDTGELQTDYGALKVRVASVFRVDEEGVEPIYHIVLEEIDDLPIEQEPAPSKPKRRPIASRFYYFPWRRLTAICVVIVAVVLVGFSAFYGVRLLWQNSLNKAIAEARLAESNSGIAASPVSGAIGGGGSSPTIDRKATLPASAGTAKAAPRSTPVALAVQPSLRAPTSEQLRLPGAQSFVVPEVVAALVLSAKQASTLKNVNDATERAVHDLDRLWPSDSPDQHARRLEMIWDAARQQALRLLTAEQRHRLVALMKQ